MISIGTYLGGVWANESWGRYWGWDAKETWALVTILVYAFILHMRIIPKMQGLYMPTTSLRYSVGHSDHDLLRGELLPERIALLCSR
jgi:ABC-type transport system involved in cytochrome c biogenesis permease subunit